MKEQIAVQNAAMEKENAELEADFEHLAHVREIAAIEAAIKTLQIEEEVKELMNISLVPKRELNEKYVNDLPDEDYNTPRLMSQLLSQHLNLGQPIMMTFQRSQFEPRAFVQLQKESIQPAHRTSNQEQTTVDQTRGLATDFTRFLLKKRPAIGLMRIWECLEERYDSPEMIDSALKAKLHPSRNYQIKSGKNSTI